MQAKSMFRLGKITTTSSSIGIQRSVGTGTLRDTNVRHGEAKIFTETLSNGGCLARRVEDRLLIEQCQTTDFGHFQGEDRLQSLSHVTDSLVDAHDLKQRGISVIAASDLK